MFEHNCGDLSIVKTLIDSTFVIIKNVFWKNNATRNRASVNLNLASVDRQNSAMRYAFEACAVRSLVSVTIIAKGIVLLKNQCHSHHASSQKPASPKAIPISEFSIKDILYYL